MIYVYVAGPYTHPDPVLNVRAAMDAAERLWSHGFVPFIPHLSMFQYLVHPQPLAVWYLRDLPWVDKCDVLLRIQPEIPSCGADEVEIPRARELGLAVYFNIEDLIDAYPRDRAAEPCP